MTENTKLVIKISQEKMPFSCWGRYGRVAVMEMEADAPFPAMISSRARGCVKVHKVWNKLFWGISAQCALRRAEEAARRLIKTMEENKK